MKVRFDMNIINEIRDCMSDSKYLKIAIFSEDEVAFYLWEEEVSFIVNPQSGAIIFDVEGYDWHLNCDQLAEMVEIMGICQNHMNEIKSWVKNY
jgi:hypothetical protein